MTHMANTMTVKERREQLNQALKLLTTSEGWARYLKMRAGFHSYSFGNLMLILMQCSEATICAGYNDWRDKHGRQVRKGEKGLYILAPVFKKIRNDETGEDEKRLITFRVVKTFDVSQTDGEPLAAHPCQPIEGDAPEGAWDHVVRVATNEGLRVEVGPAKVPGAEASLNREGRVISVTEGKAGAAMVASVLHELAHWFDPEMRKDGYSYAADRPEAECVAESVAYITSADVGIASDPYSVGYVAHWAKGDLAKVEKVAARVDKTATTLREAMELASKPVAVDA